MDTDYGPVIAEVRVARLRAAAEMVLENFMMALEGCELEDELEFKIGCIW